MPVIPSLPDLAAIIRDLTRRLEALERTPQLPSASIGAGGLKIKSGGGLTIEGGGDLVITGGGTVEVDGADLTDTAVQLPVIGSQFGARTDVGTSWTTVATKALSVPSWATKALCVAMIVLTLDNQEATGDNLLEVRAIIDGFSGFPEVQGGKQHVAAGKMGSASAGLTDTIASPGATVTFAAEAQLDAAITHEVFGDVIALMIAQRA